MSKTSWIIFAAIVVLLFGGLVVYSRSTNPSVDVSNVDTNSIIAASDQNGNIADHTFGKADSKVVLVEYGDFQCISCYNAHPNIKEITEDYEDRVVFVFRNFPLTSIHPNARAAAAAVEAAGLSGKYWEMHNAIFESKNDWENLNGDQRTDFFVNKAKGLDIDEAKFKEDLAGTAVNQKISFDQALGKKLNVTGTPTFYLQGEKISDELSNNIVSGDGSLLREALDAALRKEGVDVPTE